MSSFRKICVSIVALAAMSSAARADITIGFVTSLSGPGSSIGIPYGRGIAAAFAYRGEVAGQKIKLIQLDDASDPSSATRNARKLAEDEKVDLLIGTATAPSTIAIAAVATELKVPFIAVSPIQPTADPANQWAIAIPQPAPLLVKVVADRMKRDGVKKVGYIGFSDAWGDLVYNGAKAAEGRGDIEVVANERYARTDTSVTGQVLKLVAAKPDGILDGGSATQGALPLLGLAERGYKGPTYGTTALVNPDFVRVGAKAAEGIQVSTGPVIVADQLPDGHFAKKLSADFKEAFQKANGVASTDGFSGYSFDAWLVMLNAVPTALKAAQPGTPEFRTALRGALLATTEVPGVHAVYNFKPGASHGVDERSLVIVQLKNGVWTYKP